MQKTMNFQTVALAFLFTVYTNTHSIIHNTRTVEKDKLWSISFSYNLNNSVC